MAYSESPITVERMLPFLQPLTDGSEVTWRVAPGHRATQRFAYKVREALAVAKLFPDRFPELARIADDFRVVVRSSREVAAVPRAPLMAETYIGPSNSRVVTTPEHSVMGIIESWVRRSEGEAKVYFPSANLSDEELHQLWEWAQSEGLMFFENAGALTLMQHDPETAEFAWAPED